jgi:tripartite-type tricarboxylate transporter receptor subunit TctC
MPTLPALAAEAWPSRPIRMVVPFAPGGGSDVTGRIIGQKLSELLAQSVVVDNRPGAASMLGTDLVARAAGDGYTLLLADLALTINPAYFVKQPPADPAKAFTGVALVAETPYILMVNPGVPAGTIKEFIALAKAQPGKLTYASSGNGTNPQLGGILFGMQTGTSSLHVPFGGIAPALNALLGGQVDYMFDSATSIPHVQAGKVKALAVVGQARLSSLPTVPALSELGFADMTAVNGFYAVMATAGTPPDVVSRLNTEIVRIMRQPGVMERVNGMGLVNATSTPEQLGQAIADDLRRLGPIIREAKISLQ